MIPRDDAMDMSPQRETAVPTPAVALPWTRLPMTSQPEFPADDTPAPALKLEPLLPIDASGEIRSLDEEIVRAEAQGMRGRLAELCLLRGKELITEGRKPEAAEHFRKCVRAAVAAREKAVHAAARIELADLSREADDLTTACEHWQIARGLFFDLKEKDQLSAAETAMRRHGCPTDWVLNDF